MVRPVEELGDVTSFRLPLWEWTLTFHASASALVTADGVAAREVDDTEDDAEATAEVAAAEGDGTGPRSPHLSSSGGRRESNLL